LIGKHRGPDTVARERGREVGETERKKERCRWCVGEAEQVEGDRETITNHSTKPTPNPPPQRPRGRPPPTFPSTPAGDCQCEMAYRAEETGMTADEAGRQDDKHF
ncbi:unnamed protein product, partial [Pleuronectes platessa]